MIFFLVFISLTLALLAPHSHKERTCGSEKKNVILSAYEGGNPPVAFNWMKILATDFVKGERNYVLLLHGANLVHGLQERYAPMMQNKYVSFLSELALQKNVSIKICHLCMALNNYTDAMLLPFVQ